MAPPTLLKRTLLIALGTMAMLSLVMVVSLLAPPAGAEMVNLPVPYHEQVETWYCAEASLQMVFDYWGEEIPQHDIGDVANERPVGGTYASDVERAARFSNRSTAVQPREGGGGFIQGYDQRPYGYGAFSKQWNSPSEDRAGQLKDLVREGYPVILLCWLDEYHSITHYRVLKGFDEEANDFIFHDPVLGANKRFDIDLFVDDLWNYYDRWGVVVVPWTVEVEAPPMVGLHEEFEVRVNVSYTCPELFVGTDPYVSWPQDAFVTIDVPGPFNLSAGKNATAPLGIARAGDHNETSWLVRAPLEAGLWEVEISVLAGALVRGQSITYGQYVDFIGGAVSTRVVCDAARPTFDHIEVVGGPDFREHSVPINYSTSDVGSGVEGVFFKWQGSTSWIGPFGPEGDVTLEPVGMEGTLSITASVTDLFGNSELRYLDVFIDTLPPWIDEFQLAHGKEIVTNRFVPVDLKARDADSDVEMVSFQVGPTTWTPWEPYKEAYELELSSDGDYTVSVRVRDAMGHVASASADITLDTTPPYIDLFQVAEGLHFVTHRTVDVSIGAFDNLDETIEGEVWETGGGVPGPSTPISFASGSTLDIQWTLSGEGERTLTVSVHDRALHTDEASVTLVVDSQPPVISLVLNGGDPLTTDPDIPIALSAIDTVSEVGEARIRIDENAWGPWSDLGTFRRIDLGPGEGPRVVHAQVMDTAGNMAETNASVHLDATAPTASISFTRLETGGVVAVDTSVTLTFSERMDTSSVEVLLLDNGSGKVDCELNWSQDGTVLGITPVKDLPKDTSFTLTVQGTDLIGNELDLRTVVFSTPEAEGDDWDLQITGDTAVLLLLLVLVLAATSALGYGLVRRRR
jgi:hypothetical protein